MKVSMMMLIHSSWTAVRTDSSSVEVTAETKSDDDGGDVGRDLELQKLMDGVVNTAAPHGPT